jgi:serine phosphatase RsbU (regulator of sigma subunit)
LNLMLELKDFIHLPQLDEWIGQIAMGGPGLTVVAGVDAHLPATEKGVMIASGRAAVFRVLLRQMLAEQDGGRRLQAAVVTTDRDAVRLPRRLRDQVSYFQVTAAHSYRKQIQLALQRLPDLLVLDRLNAETAPPALLAARDGRRVLAQCDTVYRGAGVAHHFLQLKVPAHLLPGLAWVVAVQRLPMLCPHCKQSSPMDTAVAAKLVARIPSYAPPEKSCYRAPGCEQCRHSGRQGEVMAFDVFGAPPGVNSDRLLAEPSRMSLEEYAAGLAAEGYVAPEDVLQLDAGQFQRVYDLLSVSERRVADTNAALQRKVAELETANRLLQQRTEVLTSLYDVSLALTTTTSLAELARRICRYVHDLAGAGRAILYLLRADGIAQILAQRGWSNSLLGRQVTVDGLDGNDSPTHAKPAPYHEAPPGVTVTQEADRALLATGLWLPLQTQERLAGFMIVHAGRPGSSKSCFAPAEVALLQTFAGQAAVAIQRTGLIETLREKINQLEAAQSKLAQKERLERELELARQVQQSLLPHTFPVYAGYTFAAHSEPAREVGGDFYDVFEIDNGRFGLVIGDVSDKGMAAALFMALTRSLLLAEGQRELSPRQALANVNRLLLQLSEPKMFVTVFYGIVDVAARRLCYARAGHDWPLLLRRGETHRLEGNGVFLGFFDQDLFFLSEENIDLQPGDRLVLYTDGLSDQLSPEGGSVGLQQLAAILAEQAQRPPAEMCQAVFEAVARHQATAAQHDDMTLLLMTVAEPAALNEAA